VSYGEKAANTAADLIPGAQQIMEELRLELIEFMKTIDSNHRLTDQKISYQEACMQKKPTLSLNSIKDKNNLRRTA